MNEKQEIYKILDHMSIKLIEEKRILNLGVSAGQLTNAQRHEKYGQFYIKTLNEVSEYIALAPKKDAI